MGPLTDIAKITRISKKWKHRFICAGLALCGVAATWGLGELRFFQLVHLKAQDVHFIIRGVQPTPEVVLLLVDQKSLDTIPDLSILWHPFYAEAIRTAADNGAKVLGLDVTFAIPVTRWEPNHDQLLAGAVAETASRMPVVCGYVPGAMEKQRDWPVPINMIASALGLSAYANLTADPDDFIRRQELIERPGGPEPLARGLAMRVVEKYLGTDAQFEGSRLVLAGRPIPIAPDRTILLNFAGPPGTVPRVSISDFLAAARAGRKDQLRRWVEGKIVLLGPDNSIEDRHATPFYTAFSGARWNTAGVEIHASTVRTLLSRRFLIPSPLWLEVAALVTVAGISVAIAVPLAASAVAMWMSALIFEILLGTHVAFRLGLVISTSELLLVCFLSLLFSLAYRFLTAEKMETLFHNAVSVFVGKRVARSLQESETISLTGSRQFVTILFSDIRGFTAFCESKDPAEVVDLLNQYMAQMCAIIVAHHGHVNKFIGDGILAVFSDLDGTTAGDHVGRAVRCGTEMVTASNRFKTGVGIHSGTVVIGNVGSADKMEYTVLGDTVNVASRLESLNKEQKTRLLMSEATNALVDDEVETVHLGSVLIRGQTKPTNLYTEASLARLREAELKAAAIA